MTAAAESVRGEEAVRTALVRAAAGMLGEVGPSALSVREIARRAGVNHGQVHHYFGSKRALLEAAMRWLAEEHYRHQVELGEGREIPQPLSLEQDPAYWRAVCQVVMEGDLDLARIEVDEDVSVPRRALRAMQERGGAEPDDVAFKTRFAALAALQLGWVAFEDFVLLLADVGEDQREAVREELKRVIRAITRREAPWS